MLVDTKIYFFSALLTVTLQQSYCRLGLMILIKRVVDGGGGGGGGRCISYDYTLTSAQAHI